MEVARLGNFLSGSREMSGAASKATRPEGTTALPHSAKSEPSGAFSAQTDLSQATSPTSASVMTGDQVRSLLTSVGQMSLHAYAVTQAFTSSSSGAFQAVSSGAEEWTAKMQGILAFDQQHHNQEFAQQDLSILSTLEKASS